MAAGARTSNASPSTITPLSNPPSPAPFRYPFSVQRINNQESILSIMGGMKISRPRAEATPRGLRCHGQNNPKAIAANLIRILPLLKSNPYLCE
jgi:hypothetical protein